MGGSGGWGDGQENWLAEGFRARFRGVWLERGWCRRSGAKVFDGNRTYAERHCLERGVHVHLSPSTPCKGWEADAQERSKLKVLQGLQASGGKARCMDVNCKRRRRVLVKLRGGTAALRIATVDGVA